MSLKVEKAFYLVEVEFLEHVDADVIFQTNFHLELFDPEFGDSCSNRTNWLYSVLFSSDNKI